MGEGSQLTAKEVLRMQLNGSFSQLRDRLESMTDEEWRTRGVPDTNKPGFILWHSVRIIDWGVHCAIQGIPDLAYGAGITAGEAEQVPDLISREQVGAYLAALEPVALAWLDGRTDADLERQPDFESHQRVKPRYLTSQVWAEVSDFVGLPAWQILARPCISHIRVHMGEVDTLLQAIRAKAPA